MEGAGMGGAACAADGRGGRAGRSEGGLTLVGTPIGNLGDLSPRAADALRAADVVCAEDTRVSGRLLAAFGIEGRLERCDENVIARRAPQLVERMLAGERVAFVSDAGMPAVADPGARLVDACLDAGVPVDVVPGPSAVTCAIAAAGFACEAFYFGGFLPRRDAERDRLLAELAGLPAVLAFYESPHRAAASLAAIGRAFPGRRAALCRELTKLHQEVLRAPAPDLAALVADRAAGEGGLKGECVLLVDAPDADERERRRRARMAVEAGWASAGGAAGLKDGGPGSRDGGSGMGSAVPGSGGAGQGVLAVSGTPALPGMPAEFDLDAAIRAGLAAGKRTSALAKELAPLCDLTRSQVYDRICALAAE